MKRDSSLDLIRTIAILMICFNHAISTFYVDQLNPGLYNNIGFISKSFMVISYITSRFGVPLFLFLTGALVLNKKFDSSDDIKMFYKKNLLSLFITVEIWNILYYLIYLFLMKEPFSIVSLLQILTFTKNSVFGHMWYMPMILGIYIFIPFVSIIIKKFKPRNFIIPAIIILLYCFCFRYLNNIFLAKDIDFSLESALNISFSGGQYGLYIILGYYAYKQQFKNIKSSTLVITSIVFFIISCIVQAYLYKIEAPIIVYYDFFGVLIFSLCIYILLLRIKINNSKFATYMSINSLAIFYIHFPVLLILNKYISLNLNRPVLVVIFYILAIIISIILLEIFKHIKITKKYLLRQ